MSSPTSQEYHGVARSFAGSYRAHSPVQRIEQSCEKGEWKLVHSLSQHRDTVLCISVFPELHCLFTGSQDNGIHKWSMDFYTLEQELEGHTRSVVSLDRCEAGGRYLLLSCGIDNTMYLWNAVTGNLLAQVAELPCRVLSTSVMTTNTETIVCCGMMDARIGLVSLQPAIHVSSPRSTAEPKLLTASEMTYLDGHVGFVYSLSYDPEYKILFSASGDATVFVWSWLNGTLQHTATMEGHSDAVTAVRVVASSDGFTNIVSGSSDGTVKLWKLLHTTSETICVRTLPFGAPVTALLIRKGLLYIAGRDRPHVTVCHASSLQLAHSIPSHQGTVMTLGYYNAYILCGGTDAVLKVWSRQDKGSIDSAPLTMKEILDKCDLSRYSSLFQQHGITSKALPLLSDSDFQRLQIPLGHRRLLLNAVTHVTSRVPKPALSRSIEELLFTLKDFVDIPSISQDETKREACWRAARFVEDLLIQQGAETRILQAIPGKNPAVMARIRIGARTSHAKKIVFYGHYDVQPALSDSWRTEPFSLTGVNGYLYGRGTSDNKGPIISIILAIRELIEESRVNAEVILLLDGEEETSSEKGGFYDAVRLTMEQSNWLDNVDCILIANTYWLGTSSPCIVYGMRGSAHLSVSITGPNRNLHSGVHGGAIVEPMSDLVRVLASIRDEEGNVSIPHFNDDVLDCSTAEEELYASLDFCIEEYSEGLGVESVQGATSSEVLMNRWRHPALSIHSIKADHPFAGEVAAISKIVTASITMRFVPNQDCKRVTEHVVSHLHEAHKALRSPNAIHVGVHSVHDWWLGDLGSKVFRAASAAIRKSWNVEPMFIREGGTIPTSKFLQDAVKAPVVHIPFGQETDQAHLENERMRLLNLVRGKEVFKQFIHELGL